MVEIEWDERLFTASRCWIERECASESELAAAAGISRTSLDRLTSNELIPNPTYQVGAHGVRSPVCRMGSDPVDGVKFYGPAVVTWLRRCAAHHATHGAVEFKSSLRQWLAADFEAALRAEAYLARDHAWSDLFDARGAIIPAAVMIVAEQLWDEWMRGGWAVCLNRFDGHHIVVKDIEVARVAALASATDDAKPATTELIDAMLRYDSVARPFAPFERTMSSRRKTIEDVAANGLAPWPRNHGLSYSADHIQRDRAHA